MQYDATFICVEGYTPSSHLRGCSSIIDSKILHPSRDELVLELFFIYLRS